jgi:signal transduction histidine kinase
VDRVGGRPTQRVTASAPDAQRLEIMSRLAGAVAHDFNNLLSVIVNYAAFVAGEIKDASLADPDRWSAVVEDVRQIQRAADRGIALTHQLLALGGREASHPRLLSLNSLITDAHDRLMERVGERVELRTDLTPRPWPVEADPAQLEQALLVLAANAGDAMPEGGTLTLETANVTVGDNEDPPAGRYVRLRIIDTGEGMPADVAARAFEPFFTTRPKGPGAGLGLTIVSGIVASAGGHVRLESEPGRGACVTVLLPATTERPRTTP